MKVKDAQRLLHILEEAEDIALFAADGHQDRKTIKAIVRSVEIIGEAVHKLSTELKASYPDIPWQDISDMRNLLAHEYFRVDEAIVWEVATGEIPELRKKIQAILAKTED